MLRLTGRAGHTRWHEPRDFLHSGARRRRIVLPQLLAAEAARPCDQRGKYHDLQSRWPGGYLR